MPQVGPITMWVNSITRMPAKGRSAAAVLSVIHITFIRLESLWANVSWSATHALADYKPVNLRTTGKYKAAGSSARAFMKSVKRLGK